jgi:hypothetical protein
MNRNCKAPLACNVKTSNKENINSREESIICLYILACNDK